jgi:hypothetical protein
MLAVLLVDDDIAKLRSCKDARKGMMKDGPGVSYKIIKLLSRTHQYLQKVADEKRRCEKFISSPTQTQPQALEEAANQEPTSDDKRLQCEHAWCSS